MIPEDAFMDFKCPYCGAMVSFPSDLAGHIVGCPECTESIVVPEPGSPAALPLPIPIATRRLILRRFRPTDWKDLLEIFSGDETSTHAYGYGSSEEQISQWLESDSHVKLTTPRAPFNLGIELLESEKLIGYLTLNFFNIHTPRLPAPIVPLHRGAELPEFFDPYGSQVQLELLVNPSYRRKGVGTEAGHAVLEFCFRILGVHRVIGVCLAENEPATKLCQKLGMRCEGRLLKAALINLEWHDLLQFALLKDEYIRAKNHAPGEMPA